MEHVNRPYLSTYGTCCGTPAQSPAVMHLDGSRMANFVDTKSLAPAAPSNFTDSLFGLGEIESGQVDD